jgi:hypothetical protein
MTIISTTGLLTFEDFQRCMESWKSRWDRCIHAQGDYFEGESGN